jgi:hypothetical protein
MGNGPTATEPDSRIDRWAAEQEDLEWRVAELDKARAVHDRGADNYALRLTGSRIGESVRSTNELYQALNKHILASHAVESARDAEVLVEQAVAAYRRTHPGVDPDEIHAIAVGLQLEYEQSQQTSRRERLAEITRDLQTDRLKQERLAWQERVNDLARETGLDHKFVEDFLVAHATLSRPRFPGVIDPRGVPFIQLSAPRFVVAKLVKDYVLVWFPGIGIVEGIHGKDILTGQELSNLDRGLMVVADLLAVTPSRALRPLTRATGEAVRGLARLGSASAEWASAALRLHVPPEAMLRYLGRLTRIPAERIRELLARVRVARRAGRALTLAPEERRLIDEIAHLNEAFREYEGAATHLPSVPKAPTARGFIFLNPRQPQVLGSLLGRPLSGAPAAAAQVAETAQSLRARIAAHWDAARPAGGTDAAVRRIFDELKRVNPGNPNKWVRGRLYDRWRSRALGRIQRDASLVSDLREQAGIIIGRNQKTGTVSIHIRTKASGGGRTQTPLDFDHFHTGHAQAVTQALRDNDYRALFTTIDSANLQLITGRENRNFIEALRQTNREMGAEIPRTAD